MHTHRVYQVAQTDLKLRILLFLLPQCILAYLFQVPGVLNWRVEGLRPHRRELLAGQVGVSWGCWLRVGIGQEVAKRLGVGQIGGSCGFGGQAKRVGSHYRRGGGEVREDYVGGIAARKGTG